MAKGVESVLQGFLSPRLLRLGNLRLSNGKSVRWVMLLPANLFTKISKNLKQIPVI